MDLKGFRKQWNKDQKDLRGLLAAGPDLKTARELFLKQHQVLHSKTMSGVDSWSYADEIFSDIPEEHWRVIPDGGEHSLVWILWHISRIEDITMRVLVEDAEQEYLAGGWMKKLASPIHHTGNDAALADVIALSRAVDPGKLLAYRVVVGRNTRALVKSLDWAKLRKKVLPERLNRFV